MSDITDPSGRVIVAPQKPFRDRHRDLISAGIGALIALLGTCAGQVNQYVLTEKQIRQDAAERQQREAVAAFDEVSAAMNAVLRTQRQARTRLTKVSALSRRDLFDTLQSLGLVEDETILLPETEDQAPTSAVPAWVGSEAPGEDGSG